MREDIEDVTIVLENQCEMSIDCLNVEVSEKVLEDEVENNNFQTNQENEKMETVNEEQEEFVIENCIENQKSIEENINACEKFEVKEKNDFENQQELEKIIVVPEVQETINNEVEDFAIISNEVEANKNHIEKENDNEKYKLKEIIELSIVN